MKEPRVSKSINIKASLYDYIVSVSEYKEESISRTIENMLIELLKKEGVC